MTNILEKTLLTGFGVFILIISLSFITPFITSIFTFKSNQNDDLESYISLIDEIDQCINHIIEHPENVYLKTIEYPKNLNMTFKGNVAKFFFNYKENYQTKIVEYSKPFVECDFENILPLFYVLNISMKLSKILVELK